MPDIVPSVFGIVVASVVIPRYVLVHAPIDQRLLVRGQKRANDVLVVYWDSLDRPMHATP